jgi:hypothetical protein
MVRARESFATGSIRKVGLTAKGLAESLRDRLGVDMSGGHIYIVDPPRRVNPGSVDMALVHLAGHGYDMVLRHLPDYTSIAQTRSVLGANALSALVTICDITGAGVGMARGQ